MENEPDYLEYVKEQISISDESLNSFTDENEFNQIGVEVFKEACFMLIPIASLRKKNSEGDVPYNKSEAAIMGNLARYVKLSNALLEQFVKKRGETVHILIRCLAETYINTLFLLKFSDSNTINHYIKQSLRIEKQMLQIIQDNIKSRDSILPIEKRMIDSIKRTISLSGFDENKLTSGSKWDDKVRARIFEIIDPEFYVLLYGTSSHAVHGNWQDLIDHHLIEKDGGFFQNNDWNFPHYQLLMAATMLTNDLTIEVARKIIPEGKNKTKLINAVSENLNLVLRINSAHELLRQKIYPSLNEDDT